MLKFVEENERNIRNKIVFQKIKGTNVEKLKKMKEDEHWRYESVSKKVKRK